MNRYNSVDSETGESVTSSVSPYPDDGQECTLSSSGSSQISCLNENSALEAACSALNTISRSMNDNSATEVACSLLTSNPNSLAQSALEDLNMNRLVRSSDTENTAAMQEMSRTTRRPVKRRHSSETNRGMADPSSKRSQIFVRSSSMNSLKYYVLPEQMAEINPFSSRVLLTHSSGGHSGAEWADFSGGQMSGGHCRSEWAEFNGGRPEAKWVKKTIVSTSTTASSLVISSNRRRFSKLCTSNQDDEQQQSTNPAPPKVAKLGFSAISSKKERETWAKQQKELLQKLYSEEKKTRHVILTNPKTKPPAFLYTREARKELKHLAAHGAWEEALELIENSFLTHDIHDVVLNEVTHEAVDQGEWGVVEQLLGMGFGRRLLNKVFSRALEKDQWRWVQHMMKIHSRDIQLNAAALHEAVKISKDERPVLELLQESTICSTHTASMEGNAEGSFFDAVNKWFWKVAIKMVSKQYVTQAQCEEACRMALLEAYNHYKSVQQGGHTLRSGSKESGGSRRLQSEKRQCADLWSFLHLLAQLETNRQTIQSCIQDMLASNDWAFVRRLACLLPSEPDDNLLSLLFIEAAKREDWAFVVSRLPPNAEFAHAVLETAVARGAWNSAAQILRKTLPEGQCTDQGQCRRAKTEGWPTDLMEQAKAVLSNQWTNLDVVLLLQEMCSDDVMCMAFKTSVRKGYWEYVALLAHPSVKDEYRWAATDEVILQWAHVFLKLLMSGVGHSPREDGSEGMFTPLSAPYPESFTPNSASSGYFRWSMSSVSEPRESPFSPLNSLSEIPFPFQDPLLHPQSQTETQDDLNSKQEKEKDNLPTNSNAFHCDSLKSETENDPVPINSVFHNEPMKRQSLQTYTTPLSPVSSPSGSTSSHDDVFLPAHNESDDYSFQWKDIRQNGQYLYTLVQIMRCLSKENGQILHELRRDQMKEALTRWAQTVRDMLHNVCFTSHFLVDEVCCTLLYTVEKKTDALAQSHDATSEMAWACVPVLVTQTINEDLAQFTLDHILSERRWDVMEDVLLFGLDSFTETGRQLIFKQALEDKQWDMVQCLAEYDLYHDQVKEAVKMALDAQQTNLVLLLLDRQQLDHEDIQTVLQQAVKNCQWDLILPLLERGADVSCLSEDSFMQSKDRAHSNTLEEELISSVSKSQEHLKKTGCDAKPNATYSQSLVQQLRTADSMSDAEQWELLQEAVCQQKWHIVAQAVLKCRIGCYIAVHRKLYPEALLQGQWGVIRALVKRGVQDFPYCYHSCCSDWIQRGKWSIVGEIFKPSGHCIAPSAQISLYPFSTTTPSSGGHGGAEWVKNHSANEDYIFSAVLNIAVNTQEWSAVLQLIQAGVSQEQRMALFHAAVAESNWPLMKQLVQGEDSQGISFAEFAFDFATAKSNWDMVSHCVQQGVDINRQDSGGNTALHLAVVKKDRDGVHTLIQHKPDINKTNADQQTPMHIAAKINAWDLVKLMIENGGDITIADRRQNTVLKYLLESAQASLLQLAVEKGCNGCDIANYTVKNRTVYQVLLAAGYHQTVMKMVEQGSDPCITTDGKSLLHFAVNRTSLSSMESCVSLCISLGLSTHQAMLTENSIRPASFASPHMCGEAKLTDMIKLPDTSGDGKLTDLIRNSPTCLALRNKSVPFKILWMLLESGASSNKELYLLKSWRQLKQLAGTDQNSRQKLLYLKIAASNPHSLKHLCRLKISHQMGCQGDRQERITSLPLPRRLKDYVSFSDILSVVKYQGKRML